MKIRTEQINEIEKARKQDFVKEVALEIRTQHGDECKDLDDEELRKRVEEGFEQASPYGLKQKYSLSMFVQLQFLSAPNFDKYPTVRYVLTHPSVEPDDKIDRIIEMMRESDWEEIRRRATEVGNDTAS